MKQTQIELIDKEIAYFVKQKNAAEEMATQLANDFVAGALDFEDLIRNKKEKPNPRRPTESLHVENVSSSPKQSLVSLPLNYRLGQKSKPLRVRNSGRQSRIHS